MTARSGQALGPGGAEIVLAQHLQHARAREARDRRRRGQREGQRGQHHARPALAAEGREPPELDREHEHQHEPQPEPGHGDADQRHQHGEEVRPAAAAHGRGDPGEDAEHRGQAHRHQGQLHGRPRVLDQDARDRPVLLEGLAEIAVQRPAEEAREPDEERVVQAELLPQDLDVLGRGAEVGDEHRGGVARKRVHEREDGGRDPQEDEEGRGQSPGEEAGHGSLRGAWARRPASRDGCPARRREPDRDGGYFFSHISEKYAS